MIPESGTAFLLPVLAGGAAVCIRGVCDQLRNRMRW